MSERVKVVKELTATYRVERYVGLGIAVIVFLVVISYVVKCLFFEGSTEVNKINLLNASLGSGGILTGVVGLLTWQHNRALSFIAGNPAGSKGRNNE